MGWPEFPFSILVTVAPTPGGLSNRKVRARFLSPKGFPPRRNGLFRTEAILPLLQAAQFAREDSKKGLGLAQPVKRRWPLSRQSYYSCFDG